MAVFGVTMAVRMQAVLMGVVVIVVVLVLVPVPVPVIRFVLCVFVWAVHDKRQGAMNWLLVLGLTQNRPSGVALPCRTGVLPAGSAPCWDNFA